MRLETFTTNSKEILIEAATVNVTVNVWGNLGCCSVLGISVSTGEQKETLNEFDEALAGLEVMP